MGRIWVPLKQPPHPSGISGLSTDGEKVLRALTQRHREKISTQTSANTKPGMWQIGVECGGAVVRAPALESQGCEFDSHWVSTLATLGKLLT